MDSQNNLDLPEYGLWHDEDMFDGDWPPSKDSDDDMTMHDSPPTLPVLERQNARGNELVPTVSTGPVSSNDPLRPSLLASQSDRVFRLQAKNLILTYPQCLIEKSNALEQIKTILQSRGVEYAVVSCEDHKDTEGKHLHAFVRLKRNINVQDPKVLDLKYLGERYHGNYQSCKSVPNSIKYVMKDGDYVEFGESPVVVEERVKKNDTVSQLIFDKIRDGAAWADLMVQFGPYMILHMKTVRAYYDGYRAISKKPTELLSLVCESCPKGENCEWKKVLLWLAQNVIGKPERSHGKEQLYVVGPTQCGKSWFVKELGRFYNVYWAPETEEFFDGLSEDHDVVVFDEFLGQHKVTFMNNFVDGTPTNVKQKGTQYHKEKNVPCIVLSNVPMSAQYPNCPEVVREAFARRFTQVSVDHKCHLQFTG